MSLKIRPATQGDVLLVTSVIKEVYDEYHFTWDPDDYHADLYDLKAYYFDLGHRFWLAEVDGLAVATCALELFQTLPGTPGEIIDVDGQRRIGGSDCSLQRLYVRPSARKGGVGGALLAETLKEARHQGKLQMEIWSDKRFEAAHRLYQRLGASVVGDRVCDDPDESPEWGLALPL